MLSVRSGVTGRFKKMAETTASLVRQLRALQLQVESLKGLQTVVEEQKAVIRELRALLEAPKAKEDLGPLIVRHEAEDGWKQVAGRKKKKGKATFPVTPVTQTRNSFSGLEDQCSGNIGKTEETTLSKGKVVVVGDSQVRGLGRLFCVRDARRRMCVCLPGAGVRDVAERLEGVLGGEGVAPTVCISAGGNDIGKVRPEELLRRYRQALERVRELGGTPVLCGILPRRGAGVRWWSEATALNSRLADHCRRNGWLFVDNWSYFYGKDHLYSRDGVHLSEMGTGALAWSLQRDLQQWGFLGGM